MNFRKLLQLIKEDYYRLSVNYSGGKLKFFPYLFWKESLMVTFWFRIGSYLYYQNSILAKLMYVFVKIVYKHIQHKTGIQLPFTTNIDGGLEFFHYGCIIIAASVKIGKNVSIHQGVTLGRVFEGIKKGVPTIGDNVVIFAGAKIVGNVSIGNNSVIGTNAVVVNNVPDNCVVAGVPAKIISYDSSKCFDDYWNKIFGRE